MRRIAAGVLCSSPVSGGRLQRSPPARIAARLVGNAPPAKLLLAIVLAYTFVPPASAGTSADASWPAWVLDLPPSVGTFLVADTGEATLYEYTRAEDGRFELTEHYMSIGLRGAGKRRAGDQRTPLGIYFIVDQLDTTRLDPKYGVTAFPLDYPNTLDRIAGRTGDGIWLHGVPPGDERRPVWDTDGCIALANGDLEALAPRLELNATPVIVTRAMHLVDPDALVETTAMLRAALESWRIAIETGDAMGYLSLYAESFTYRGLDREEWVGFRAEQFASRKPASVEIEDLVLLQEPEDESTFIARFRLRRQGADARQSLIKRLYWRRDDAGVFRIVAEDNG
jgi:murein L,D-transpeptidase YafK